MNQLSLYQQPGQKLLNITGVLLVASVVTVALFAFMASLIAMPEKKVTIAKKPVNVEVLVSLKDTQLEITKPIKSLPKPDKATPPPPRQVVEIQDNATPPSTSIKTAVLTEGIGSSIIGAGNEGNSTLLDFKGQNQTNTDATPIVQITPRYPIVAARNGIEGWVRLSFSINPDGTVSNIDVMDAQPKRIFNKAAKKALKGWRYRAKFVDSVAVAQHGLQVQLDFELEK